MEWLFGILSIFLWIVITLAWRKRYKIIDDYQPKVNDVTSEIGFSIIICIRGKAEHFSKYIEKVYHQNYQNFELLLVSKKLDGELKNFIEKFTRENNRTTWIDIDALNLPYSDKKQALNIGIAQAKYDWTITIDDDSYPEDENWLSSYNQFIQNNSPDIVLGLSPYISQRGILNQWIRYDAFYGAMNYVYHTIIGKPYMGVGRNMAFKKELWTKEYLDIYDNLGSGDDTTLVQFYCSTKSIQILLSSLVYSFPKLKFSDWFFQKMRHIQKGKLMRKDTLHNLAYLPLLSFAFWLTLWLWLSYFAFHFIIFLLVALYFMSKIFYEYKIAKRFRYKTQPIFYSIFFDVFYNFWLLASPFVSIFIRKKWR